MASKYGNVVFCFRLVLLLVFVFAEAAPNTPSKSIKAIKRRSFPKGFVFGTASSSYQYEGAAFEHGKGPNIWDNYTHQYPERIVDHSNGDIAVDSYHRYKEDIAIMKQTGLDAYRFSISWARILPKGNLSGGVNKEGIEYYNNLINELLANGIQPYVTLFHWDVPQALQDQYQGFMGRQIVNDFRDYAELCFKEYGDRVKHWITLNEQVTFALQGYVIGKNAPGRCSKWFNSNCIGGDAGTEPYIVGHNLILAHANAVKVYKTRYQKEQKGEIGITLVSAWFVPYSDTRADKEAASRVLDFSYGWFLHPLVYGDYPPVMRSHVKDRLPKFTKEETILTTGSYDFLGINYYTANYAIDTSNSTPPGLPPHYLIDIAANVTTDRDGISIGRKVNDSSWLAAYPQGLREVLLYTKNNYKNPIIYVTENGWLDYDSSDHVEELIHDNGRVKYFHDHLLSLREAIKAGVRVKGYFAWSLLDNFEWADGYSMRFGLVYIDFKNNLKRIPKLSLKWFQNFLKN
ncbi:beta-glucosidase 12-like [Momordica charantia]|uniref:Beta-glucosidase 12-like n=1 Tax=Momordica charantia TaxID=3673 RepID=A0A6J1DKX8_MOMCH|nr:beta-glucosidase 12-like [Momordica charantia]XP_022154060.1 beta-glucosidase 12-like [Momordica charantia]XP_022154061.1 beta-glucosidase 12-like [Momordica charantia]